MSDVVVLYASTHGSTRKVVGRLPEMATFPFDCFNVKDVRDLRPLARYRAFLFFAPAYGNEELQPDMERFLLTYNIDMTRKGYAICELGNYYGYDGEFGAMRIIRFHMEQLHGTEIIEPLSMDTLPKKDWQALASWCGRLNAVLPHANE